MEDDSLSFLYIIS